MKIGSMKMEKPQEKVHSKKKLMLYKKSVVQSKEDFMNSIANLNLFKI